MPTEHGSTAVVDSEEQALLGSIILAPDASWPAVEASGVESRDFRKHSHSVIFSAAEAMRQQKHSIDVVTLADKLSSLGLLAEAEGMEYLARLVSEVPNAANAGEYARAVVRGAAVRRAGLLARAFAEKIEGGKELDGELDSLRRECDRMMSQKSRVIESLSGKQIEEMDLGAVEWIVFPLVARGMLSQIQGAPKQGKSCFAQFLALATSIGSYDMGPLKISTPRTILYMAYEDGLGRIKRRWQAYSRGLGLDGHIPENCRAIKAPILTITNQADYESIKATIMENRVDLLIIDTLIYVHGRDENSAKEMKPVMDALMRLAAETKVGILVVHHTRKPGSMGESGGVSERGRGSSVIAGAYDIIINWGARVAANTTNVSVVSKETTELEFSVEYQEDGPETRWTVGDVVEREGMKETRRKAWETIEKLLEINRDGLRRSTLAAAMGCSPNSAKAYLDFFASPEGGNLLKVESGPNNVRLYMAIAN